MGFSDGEIKQGYIRNILFVLNEIKRLIENLDGKIVITSDHCNLFGEYGIYDHPYNLHIPKLIEFLDM